MNQESHKLNFFAELELLEHYIQQLNETTSVNGGFSGEFAKMGNVYRITINRPNNAPIERVFNPSFDLVALRQFNEYVETIVTVGHGEQGSSIHKEVANG